MSERWVCKRCFADNEETDSACLRCGLVRGAESTEADKTTWASQAAAPRRPPNRPAGSAGCGTGGSPSWPWPSWAGTCSARGVATTGRSHRPETLASTTCVPAIASTRAMRTRSATWTAFHAPWHTSGRSSRSRTGRATGRSRRTASSRPSSSRSASPRSPRYVGEPWETSAIYGSMISPSEDSWGGGDREFICVLYDPEDTQLTESLRGANR